MRRPPPIPTPSDRPSTAVEGGGTDAAGPAVLDDSPADARRPAVLPLPGERAHATESFAGTAGTSPDAADADPVRLRDVWRAARARRKALRAEVRRFTARQRHRRAIWTAGIGAVVLVAAGTVGAAYSPLFAVEDVRVLGTSELDPVEVADALSGELGTPLALVDDSAVKAALVAFPLVESYTLEARPPHELVVRIVERTPIGLVQTPAGYTLVDAAGVALSTTASPPEGEPLLDVTGGRSSAAFAAVGQVMRSLPDDIRAQVTAVTASTPDDVTLTLGGTNTQVVWGSAEESARKALVLSRIMLARPPASVTAYDVSSPSAAVVR